MFLVANIAEQLPQPGEGDLHSRTNFPVHKKPTTLNIAVEKSQDLLQSTEQTAKQMLLYSQAPHELKG